MIKITSLVIILFGIMFIAGGRPLIFNIEPSPAYSSDNEAQPRNIARLNLAPEFVGLVKEPDFPLTAKNILVSDNLTSEPLFTRRAHEFVPIASLTKLMTALVLLDQDINFDDEIEIKGDDLRGGVPEILVPGEKILARDLWNLMLVSSYNTAVAALVRQVGFGELEFVNLMRDKANELFLFEIELADVTGLDPANRASARNIAKLARKAFETKEIAEVTARSDYEFKTKNTNRLVRVLNTRGNAKGIFACQDTLCADADNDWQILGGKTGYLDESKFNLALKIRKDNHDIIVIILGSETKESRLEEAESLINWTFENWQWP